MYGRHIDPLKWHYLALFQGVPISESQVKKRVRTNQKRSRYTLPSGTQKWSRQSACTSCTSCLYTEGSRQFNQYKGVDRY